MISIQVGAMRARQPRPGIASAGAAPGWQDEQKTLRTTTLAARAANPAQMTTAAAATNQDPRTGPTDQNRSVRACIARNALHQAACHEVTLQSHAIGARRRVTHAIAATARLSK